MRYSHLLAASAALFLACASSAFADDTQCQANFTSGDHLITSHEDFTGVPVKEALKKVYQYALSNGWTAQVDSTMDTMTATKAKSNFFAAMNNTPAATLTFNAQVESIHGGSRVTVTMNRLTGYWYRKSENLQDICAPLNIIDSNGQRVANAE